MGIDTHYPHEAVWIIVPAFNEAQVIGDVVADLRSAFANVVCVDDGSRDETGEAALQAGAHVVRHPVNASARALPSRPGWSTPAANLARRCSPPSTPTASTG